MKKLLSALVIGALALTACGGGESSTSGKQGGYDISSIAKVDEIADSLPDDIKSKGKIVVGMSADYAPAEFLDDDLKTPIGYDVEFGKAIGKVLGIEVSFENAQFDSILGAIGTKYDLGISSFTITEERLKAANMISYIEVGSSFGVAKGNPKGISVDELCGLAIGVQTGTLQFEELEKLSKECESAGKEAIKITPYPKQAAATTNLVGGKLDLIYADSQVTNYAGIQTEGAVEPLGDMRDSAPQGIVVAQDNKQFAEAVQKAVQHLMDEGTWEGIAKGWGMEKAVLKKAELNPKQ